jgi:hypothetical protein
MHIHLAEVPVGSLQAAPRIGKNRLEGGNPRQSLFYSFG